MTLGLNLRPSRLASLKMRPRQRRLESLGHGIPAPQSSSRRQNLALCPAIAVLIAWALMMSSLVLAGKVLAEEGKVVIGLDNASPLLTILKKQGALEAALAERDLAVEWKELAPGMAIMEALHAGSIDVGSDVAGTVPLFAQSAGLEFTYFLQDRLSWEATGVVATEDASITGLGYLKGRSLGVGKASGAHCLALRALRRAGLNPGIDVKIIFMTPAQASEALESGAIDAWAVSDPYLATAQMAPGIRKVEGAFPPGEAEIRFFPISTKFLAENPEAALIIAEELMKLEKWLKANPDELAESQAGFYGLSQEAAKLAGSRRGPGLTKVSDDAVKWQQRMADILLEARLLSHPLNVAQAPRWSQKAEASPGD